MVEVIEKHAGTFVTLLAEFAKDVDLQNANDVIKRIGAESSSRFPVQIETILWGQPVEAVLHVLPSDKSTVELICNFKEDRPLLISKQDLISEFGIVHWNGSKRGSAYVCKRGNNFLAFTFGSPQQLETFELSTVILRAKPFSKN